MSSKSDLTFVVSINDGWRVTFRLCKSRTNVLGKSTSMLNVAEIIDSVGRAIGLRGTAVVKFRVDQENSARRDCITRSSWQTSRAFFLNNYGGKSHTASINIEMRRFMLNERTGFKASQARCIEIFAVLVKDSSSRLQDCSFVAKLAQRASFCLPNLCTK
jgi:hypothetical protein